MNMYLHLCCVHEYVSYTFGDYQGIVIGPVSGQTDGGKWHRLCLQAVWKRRWEGTQIVPAGSAKTTVGRDTDRACRQCENGGGKGHRSCLQQCGHRSCLQAVWKRRRLETENACVQSSVHFVWKQRRSETDNAYGHSPMSSGISISILDTAATSWLPAHTRIQY